MHDPETIHDDAPATNTSDNRPFDDVLKARMGRRAVLGGTLGSAIGAFLVASPATAATRAVAAGPKNQAGNPSNKATIGFTPIPLYFGTDVSVSDDYTSDVIIPWGTPLSSDTPDWSYPPTSAAAQADQVGIGHDGMWFFPLGGPQENNDHGLLCINHEFGTNKHVFDDDEPQNAEQVTISQNAHGCSVIELMRDDSGQWQVVQSDRSRRITVNTPVEFSGPAAGSPLLMNAAGNEPQGTLNNCANGYTPWGTYLTCEENYNGYFGTEDPDWEPNETQGRYGFDEIGFEYYWHRYDPRFDVANPDYAGELHRFGWVVEIDPNRPDVKPVKRTALGRVKHEGAATTVGRGGRVVVYMGDDERFDYIYKFVSEDNYKSMIAKGQSPLDHGTLYVARFNDDGSGDWLELSLNNPDVAAVFSSMDEVVTFARLAADAAGATPMDRPEWTTVAINEDVYCTLTNTSRRTEPNAANPQAPNPNGHIIRWRDADHHVGTTFEWDIFILASETEDTDHGFGSPDGLWADPDGRLFIETDGRQPPFPPAEEGANDQLLVANPATGEIRRLFSGPKDCEITGIAVTPDRRTMFINVQHPGNGDGGKTLFPYGVGDVPRDATVVLQRKDGGIIGS